MDTGGKNCPRLRCIINSIVLIGHLKLLHTLPSEPLIVRGVSFHERGSRLLVCYLESHEVYVSFFIMPSESFLTAFTSLCMKIESWTKEWFQQLVTRMYVSLICHFSLYDGCLWWCRYYFWRWRDVNCLKSRQWGRYVCHPPQEPLRSFRHSINRNVPLLVSSPIGSSLIVVGSDNGHPRIYDHHTGNLSASLPHGEGKLFPFEFE